MIKNKKAFFCPITMAVITITSMVTILQFLYPEILNMLRRDPTALTEGEWWRIITPLLVHADGWMQFVFNIACIAIIGIEVEQLYSRAQFLILYLVGGGLAGEIAGYASWDPYGAGASVGFCGLLGGLFIMMLSRQRRVNTLSAIFSLYVVVGLVGSVSGETYVSVGLFIAVAFFLSIIMKRNKREILLSSFTGLTGLLGAVILLVIRDIHGVAILGGSLYGIYSIVAQKNP